MSGAVLDAETYARIDELVRIGRRAVAKAQEENRRRGVPNVYSINGVLLYELPTGELTTVDPYREDIPVFRVSPDARPLTLEDVKKQENDT